MERIGIEPMTSSLQNVPGAAWLSGNGTAKPKWCRSEPLRAATVGWSLAHNWRAARTLLNDVSRTLTAKSGGTMRAAQNVRVVGRGAKA